MTPDAYNCDPALTLDVPDWDFISEEEAYAINDRLTLRQMHGRAVALEQELMDDLTYAQVGSGYSRTVFHQPKANAVIKVPKGSCPDGHRGTLFTPACSLACNPLEAAYYAQGDYYGYKVMPCRLLWTCEAVPVLVMELISLTENQAHEDCKPRGCWEVDGGQVAWSSLLQSWAAFDASGPLMGSEKRGVVRLQQATLADYREFVPHPFQTIA